jgi:hypothetical protein
MQPAVPEMAMGRIGTPSSAAAWKAPGWNDAMTPLRLRVASGKTITETPLARISRVRFEAAAPLSASPRTTGMSPARRNSQPSHGTWKSSRLTIHFISQPSVHNRQRAGMSIMERWFATTR